MRSLLILTVLAVAVVVTYAGDYGEKKKSKKCDGKMHLLYHTYSGNLLIRPSIFQLPALSQNVLCPPM